MCVREDWQVLSNRQDLEGDYSIQLRVSGTINDSHSPFASAERISQEPMPDPTVRPISFRRHEALQLFVPVEHHIEHRCRRRWILVNFAKHQEPLPVARHVVIRLRTDSVGTLEE